MTVYLLIAEEKSLLKLLLTVSVVREQQTPLFPFLLFWSVTYT